MIFRGLILQLELNYLLYRRIPDRMKKNVRRHLPIGNHRKTSAASISTIIKIFRSLFDDEDIDAKVKKTPPYYENDDMDSDDTTNDSDTDVDQGQRQPICLRRSPNYKFSLQVPTVRITIPDDSTAISVNPTSLTTLTEQLEDLSNAVRNQYDLFRAATSQSRTTLRSSRSSHQRRPGPSSCHVMAPRRLQQPRYRYRGISMTTRVQGT